MHSKSRNLSFYGWTIVFVFVFLVASCQSSRTKVTFEWKPVISLDLAGYKIHYKTNSSGPPYDGKGLAEGDSPIVVPLRRLKNPNYPRFTVHGLRKDETYFFAITAYGFEGKECRYSDEIQYPRLVPMLLVRNMISVSTQVKHWR
jgi:hypothetical protein